MKIKIRNFVFGTFIIINLCLLFPAIFSKDEIVERQLKVNVTPILSMEELGFENANLIDSSIGVLMSKNNKVGYVYNYAENLKENGNYIKMHVYIVNEMDDISLYIQTIIENKYNSIKKTESPCINSNCLYPKVNYDAAIKAMYELDENVWEADKVYSMYEIRNVEYNTIFVIKDNMVMVLTLNNLELTSDRIEVLNSKFDFVSQIIDAR